MGIQYHLGNAGVIGPPAGFISFHVLVLPKECLPHCLHYLGCFPELFELVNY